MELINKAYLIITIIALLVMLIVIVLLFKPVNNFLKNKLKKDSYETLMDVAAAAVGWAEQWLIGVKGTEKKAQVYDYVKTKADEYGLNITDEDINKVIENAVLEMKKREQSKILTLEGSLDNEEENPKES